MSDPTEWKYLIARDAEDKEYAVLFPRALVHRIVARFHRATDVRVVSAGFCRVADGQIQAYGESESLGMRSRPEDAEIIRRDFGDIDNGR